MPEQLGPELIALREKTDDFVETVLRPAEAALQGGAAPDTVRRQVVDASKAAGFFAMTQPVEFGGAQSGPLALTIVRESFGRANLMVSSHVLGPRPGVLAACEGALRTQYLEPLMRGEKRSAFAFTEPEDATRRTWARLDGDELVISGRKAFVTRGADSDFIAALVNVERDANAVGGSAMIIVDREAPGVTLERTFRSLEGGEHCGVRFEEVRVPRWHVVGELGEGLPRALRNIAQVRLAVSANACGVMQWALAYLQDKLNRPHRSGEPLANKEGVRLRYADLEIASFAARSMLYRTARLVEQGNDANAEVMATKVFCTEACGTVVDSAIQLTGANGLIEGHPLERSYRQVRSMRFIEGASDVLRINIAKERLKPPSP
ncbi:MAG: acyl-CoA dehydrogenase family protein [Pseudomonadota bacterium]